MHGINFNHCLCKFISTLKKLKKNFPREYMIQNTQIRVIMLFKFFVQNSYMNNSNSTNIIDLYVTAYPRKM